MDRLESMSALLTAVEAGSLSAASRKLGTPPATVSRKVSEREAHLRTRPVNRTSRRRSAFSFSSRAFQQVSLSLFEPKGDFFEWNAGDFRSPAFAGADRHCERQRSC